MDEPAVKKFFTSVRELREAMSTGMHLDDFDRLCLENYIALLQLSYIDWKRQYYPNQLDIRLSDPAGESDDNPLSPRSH
jgi:hypothetical protein